MLQNFFVCNFKNRRSNLKGVERYKLILAKNNFVERYNLTHISVVMLSFVILSETGLPHAELRYSV